MVDIHSYKCMSSKVFKVSINRHKEHNNFITKDPLKERIYTSIDEGIASGFGDLISHRIVGGRKPGKLNAEWYTEIITVPINKELFVHAYMETVRNAESAEDLPPLQNRSPRTLGSSCGNNVPDKNTCPQLLC